MRILFRKQPLGRLRKKFEDMKKTDYRDFGCEGRWLVELSQDHVYWGALVVVMLHSTVPESWLNWCINHGGEHLALLCSTKVRVTLWLTVSQSVCLGVEPTLWTFDQILLPFQEFGSGICCPVCGSPSLTRGWACHSLVICLCVHLLTFLCFTLLSLSLSRTRT
jgi:hypothetical protein